MYYDGVLGGYTRWAIVFLIIFVLFMLLIPYNVATTCTTTPVC
jgi:competence protein ComGC